jgi:hypothetical protein
LDDEGEGNASMLECGNTEIHDYKNIKNETTPKSRKFNDFQMFDP